HPSSSSQAAPPADLLWIAKPQGAGTIASCPTEPSNGQQAGLLNQDGSQTFTPVPAIQTDPSGTGYVVTMSDIECPPTCGTGTVMTTYTLKPKSGDPSVPRLSNPVSMTVGSYESPADARQKGTIRLLDTLDGR